MSTLKIPTEPPSWCKSPQGYRKHQLLLQQLVDYFTEAGVEVELPEETTGHDNGVDLLVGRNKVVIDLKSFWLTRGPKSRTWMSGYHAFTEGRKSTWAGKATEYYVHADFTIPVEQWLVCDASGLRMSKFEKAAPYYFYNSIQTVKSFLKQCAS